MLAKIFTYIALKILDIFYIQPIIRKEKYDSISNSKENTNKQFSNNSHRVLNRYRQKHPRNETNDSDFVDTYCITHPEDPDCIRKGNERRNFNWMISTWIKSR